MARAHFRDPIYSATAEPRTLTGAVIWVYEPGTTTPIAVTMYAAATGGTTIANPITTTSNGEVAFWLDAQQDADLFIAHPDYADRTVRVHVDGDAGDEVLKTGTQAITGVKTMTTPILTAPVITGGTQSSPTLTTPTLTTPTISGGTITDTVLGGIRSASARVLEIVSTAMLLRSPDGTKALSLNNAGELSAPGLLRRYGVYQVEDEGMVYGITTTPAAANKTAWAALIAKIAAAGGSADIHINGSLPMDGGINLHHGLSGAPRINIIGKPGRSSIYWGAAPGASTPYLDLGNSASNALFNCGIIDLEMYFSAVPTDVAKPIIRIGASASNYFLERVWLRNSGSGLAALVGIDALGGFLMRNSRIGVRDDTSTLTSAGLFPIGIRNSATATAAGCILHNVAIDGITSDDPTGARSYAIVFANAGNIDTPRLNGVHTKGHSISLLKNSGAGNIQNMTIAGDSYFDVCEQGFLLEPPTSADLATWVVDGLWISAKNKAVNANEGNGGTIEAIQFNGGFWLNMTQHGALIGAGVDRFQLNGVSIDGLGCNTPGDYVVQLGGASGAMSDAMVNSCWIRSGASSSGTMRISTAATFTATNNRLRGVNATIPADNGTTKRNANNSFEA